MNAEILSKYKKNTLYFKKTTISAANQYSVNVKSWEYIPF
jgi:hypothetical protein